MIKFWFKYYYKNDKLEGEDIQYYENGNIYIKCYYKDKLGEYIQYYENGNIEIKCYKNCKRKGKYIVYYENGNIWIKCYYKNDKKIEIKSV
jgi:antitoxin component YwqK of YwqJK toxin-antitoxin module